MRVCILNIALPLLSGKSIYETSAPALIASPSLE